jgi:hypothetical protein
MALIDKIFGRKKSLSELTKQELRKEEILVGKQRDRLMKRIEQIAGEKQKIFDQGAKQKSPELRKALAQEFELKTHEQVQVARELNLRSKELLTVSRLRLVRENTERGRALGRLNLTDKDVAKISGWIEDDTVTQDLYNERLNTLLELGSASDSEALNATELAGPGNELLDLWNQLDRGAMTKDDALKRADAAVRNRSASAEQ